MPSRRLLKFLKYLFKIHNNDDDDNNNNNNSNNNNKNSTIENSRSMGNI